MGYVNSYLKWLSEKTTRLGLKVNNGIKRIASKIYKPKPSLKDFGWINFVKAGGEDLRFNYELDEKSIIFDLGGYDGQFASDFYSKYLCKIYVFEPYNVFAKQIATRFRRNPNILVFNYGLSKENKEVQISIDSVASSTFKKSENMALIQLRDAEAFFNDKDINCIDLMKINIEGGEYDLLQHLIDSQKIRIIKNIQIQFHDFVPDAEQKMLELRKKLSQTHSPTYLFDFIWENWRINK